MVAGFLRIRHYYDRLERALEVVAGGGQARLRPNTVLVLVGQMSLGVIDALNYARGLHADHLAALHVSIDEDYGMKLVRLWADLGIEVPLESVDAAVPGPGPRGRGPTWPRSSADGPGPPSPS